MHERVMAEDPNGKVGHKIEAGLILWAKGHKG